jgi:NAD(P)H dehydrogenase (quinone)
MSGDGHLNRAYELGGDHAWTSEEFAQEMSRKAGKEVVHTSVSAAEYRMILTGAGVPPAFVDTLVDADQAINQGLLSGTPGALSRLVGRPTTRIAESIAEAMSSLWA